MRVKIKTRRVQKCTRFCVAVIKEKASLIIAHHTQKNKGAQNVSLFGAGSEI